MLSRATSRLITLAVAASWSLPALAAPGKGLNCSPDAPSGLQSGCWAQLDLSKYIDRWLAANRTAAGCDKLGFAQCYLQHNGYSGRSCNLLSRGTCDAIDTKGKYHSPEQFYVLWNIYAIYQFFNQFSEALSKGASLAGQTVDQIVTTVNPPEDASSANDVLWTVLSGGFWLLAAVPTTLGSAGSVALSGLAVASGMSSYFLNAVSGTAASTQIQLGKIGGELANLVVKYQASLERALGILQHNSTLFIAAASTGGFSTRSVTSLNTDAVNVFHDLQLFVLSQALSANGIYATRSTGVDARQFVPKVHDLSCPGLGPAGNCYQWWIDQGKGNTYALHNPSDWSANHVDLLNAAHDNGWASLSELFKVEDCQGGKKPSFDPQTKRVSCLATHRLCEWNYDRQTDVKSIREANKQFKNCDNNRDWGKLCSSFGSGIVVPQAYLGPILTNEGAYCRHQ